MEIILEKRIKMKQYRQNALYINTRNIAENYITIRQSLSPGTKLLAVIKANAYGHGLIETAKALSDNNVDGFCVATLEEAISLREAEIQQDIFLLGNINKNSMKDAILYEIVICISNIDSLNDLIDIAEKIKKTALVQIAINTGMNRIGFNTKNEISKAQKLIDSSKFAQLKMCFSHLAYCDEKPDEQNYINEYTKEQISKFEELSSELNCPKSLANSAGIFRLPYKYDYARCGIIMYGYPSVETSLKVKKALEWHTEISNIMFISSGQKIGYNCSYEAKNPMKIATISVGYGDGYLRALSNKASVIISNKYARIIGKICMDQIMVDITDIDEAKVGDDVILIGRSENLEISAEDLANIAGTISYEILLSPSNRVFRKYIN